MAKDAAPVSESQALVKRMKDQMELESSIIGSQDVRQIVEQIQASILTAATDADVLAAADAGLLSGEDMVDVPFAILDYAYGKSQYDEGLPVYAVVKAENLETLQPVNFSLGSLSGLAQLFRINELKSFTERAKNGQPFTCSIKRKQTASGYSVLFFRPLTDSEKKRVGLG